ncbi:uncharacterized protein LOC132752340 [Ruditapes philippinarum]|uniref:uncharacterized protein LOC132752340 n=1 Tax=Ruditapes philippinarum TaxID=129788 RepID=UPI00295BAE4B|nr:uncharacterized protein LOC132752340 [Ruditapes philippinarum]
MEGKDDLTDEEDNVLSLLEYMPAGVLLEIFKFLDWNDICQVSSTCTKFREVCSSATLWLGLQVLDFRNCAVPDAEKIIQILHKTPNAVHVILGDILSEDDSDNIRMANNMGYAGSINELVSFQSRLTQLVIDSLLGQKVVISNIQILVQSCPYLTHLDLTASQYLNSFSFDVNQGQRSALDNLKVVILKFCKDLQVVSLPYCPNLQQLDTSHCVSLNEITATTPKLCKLDTVGCEEITKIDLTSSDLCELCCEGMKQLDILHIGSDQLTSLNLSCCSRLSANNLLDAITNKDLLLSLNICGCKNISPDDVNSIILPQLTGLKTLKYGGHSWTNVAISSNIISQLEFSTCINTTNILLTSQSIQHVTIKDCRDFSEQELMDSFLHGKLVTRMQGLESLVSDHKEQPFFQDSGIPNLCTLKCHSLPGLHGDILSHDLRYFQYLSNVEFIHCTFLTHMFVNGWPSLTSLKIESCNRLTAITVQNVPTLQQLHVRWCGMVQNFRLTGENVTFLDVIGTNFAQLDIHCDQLDSLKLNGVCTQPKHTVSLRCVRLRELTITKCDRMTDVTVTEIIQNNPQLHSLSLIGSLSLRCLLLPSCIKTCSLTGHRTLKEIKLQSPICVHHLTLNNLPKLTPEKRELILQQCVESLRILEVRAIPGETFLRLQLQNLTSLTLDQGIHLASLEILCSKLRYLRIQGCPKLCSLTLHVESLTQVQVYHSSPLLALKCLSLHSKQVQHLARVLAYYCPKLEELSLHGSMIKGDQLYSLGQCLHSLHTVTLYQCNVGELDRQGQCLMIDSSVIDRYNGKHLMVQFIDC